jgi:hypothetical protein
MVFPKESLQFFNRENDSPTHTPSAQFSPSEQRVQCAQRNGEQPSRLESVDRQFVVLHFFVPLLTRAQYLI